MKWKEDGRESTLSSCFSNEIFAPFAGVFVHFKLYFSYPPFKLVIFTPLTMSNCRSSVFPPANQSLLQVPQSRDQNRTMKYENSLSHVAVTWMNNRIRVYWVHLGTVVCFRCLTLLPVLANVCFKSCSSFIHLWAVISLTACRYWYFSLLTTVTEI